MEKTDRPSQKQPFKVVAFGPESTGKTTLVSSLADHFSADWIPEFARTYLEEKEELPDEICLPADIDPIVKGQCALEDQALSKAQDIIFMDTNPLQTKVYTDIYFDHFHSDILDRAIRERQYDLYLLTDIDIPWENDPLRDQPQNRKEIFFIFEKALQSRQLPYVRISGDHQQRIERSIDAIKQNKYE